MEDRKRSEREFQNRRKVEQVHDSEAYDAHFTNQRFYSIDGKCTRYVETWLAQHCKRAMALDYCCGAGEWTFRMAEDFGAHATGIDISDFSIEQATAEAKKRNLDGKIRFLVDDAEHMDFPDDTFDVVSVLGVLHHLELTPAYEELARVLKPSGSVICCEPLAHNPVFMAYRRRTPDFRTAFELEHILRVSDIQKAGQYFDTVDVRFFHLASLAAVPLRKTPLFRPTLAMLDMVDEVLLRIPFVQRYAWRAVFTLANPKR